MTDAAQLDAWTEFLRQSRVKGRDLQWPSETLIRLLKGDYWRGRPESWRGLSVCDVGFGDGNNLALCASLGMKLSGTEVDEKVCTAMRARLEKEMSVAADLRTGVSAALPFADGAFDLLISWNVVHYESDAAGVRAALADYARVLKPGGWLLLSSTGPEHRVMKGAAILGERRYRLGAAADFRMGSVHTLFESEETLRADLAPHFANVLTGRTQDRLLTETLDWWIAAGRKP